jgi:hypothetical protein
LLVGQSAFDRPDVTVTVFKSRLDQIKANIRHGKYFGLRGTVYIFHVIEYQYRGLPHAHMVFRLEDAHDIDAENQQDLIDFVDSYFIAEMPRFEGEEFQNIKWLDDENELTQEYKNKAVEMVRTHNIHKCAVAINGCKKEQFDRCRCGYSRSETKEETTVNNLTQRVEYQRRHDDDLRVVPYNLQMMMDWDSHINVEYSGSGCCVQYLYKYCYKGPTAGKNRDEL